MKKGSATLVVIISAIVTILYVTSAYADVRQLKKNYNEYESKIIEEYNKEYENNIEQFRR